MDERLANPRRRSRLGRMGNGRETSYESRHCSDSSQQSGGLQRSALTAVLSECPRVTGVLYGMSTCGRGWGANLLDVIS